MIQLEHGDLAYTSTALALEGQTSNFMNPPSQQISMVAVSTVMIILTLTFVSVRLYTSLRISRLLDIEDCGLLYCIIRASRTRNS